MDIGANFWIDSSARKSELSSDFSNISHCSVPYRAFRIGRLNCSEGKGHTFESCRVRHSTPDHAGVSEGRQWRPLLQWLCRLFGGRTCVMLAMIDRGLEDSRAIEDKALLVW